MAETGSHPTTPPRSQPHAASATLETPATVGRHAVPRFEFDVQVEKVDAETGVIVEERKMEWDEMNQKSVALLLTLPGWYQIWFNNATGTILETNKKLRTALAEKEAKITKNKEVG